MRDRAPYVLTLALALALSAAAEATSMAESDMARMAAISVRVEALNAESTADQTKDLAAIWGASAAEPWLSDGNELYQEGLDLMSDGDDLMDEGIMEYNAGTSQHNMANWVGAISLANDAAGIWADSKQKYVEAEAKFAAALLVYQGGP